MSKTLKTLRITAAAILLAAPVLAEDAPSAETVVATVNGTDITLGHMISVREGLPAQYQSYPDALLFGGILDQLVQQTLLTQSLEGDLSKKARLALEVQRSALLASEAMEAELAAKIDEDAIQAAYDKAYGNYAGVPEYNASHILVPTEEEAAAIATEIRAGADFAETSKAKSTGPSGPNGGELGWFGPGQMVAPFEEAVASLEVGAVSDPVQTQFGWHVIILNDSRLQEAPSLEEVRQEVEIDAQNMVADAFINALTEAASIDKSGSEGLDPSLITQVELLED